MHYEAYTMFKRLLEGKKTKGEKAIRENKKE